MNNPEIIGIQFHDNDFYFTFVAFLQSLDKVGLQSYKNLTKEKVVELFNRSASGLYWLYQNKMEYQTDWDASSYLEIDIEDVYFDDEVKEHIKELNGWSNGEFFVLDKNCVYSV